MTAIPAGTVATSPGTGRTRASKLFVFKAASIPRVAPNSLLEARASKKFELRPVVVSLLMRLDTQISSWQVQLRIIDHTQIDPQTL